MASFTTEITIEAPPEGVWRVLADIGDIQRWNPGVVSSRNTSAHPTGMGASRHCDLGGQNYLDEEVVEWEEGRRLTMRVVDTNLPFQTIDIRFRLQAENGATVVSLSPEYTLKYGMLGAIMDRVYVRRTYEKGMRVLLRGLKEHVENPGLGKMESG
jgi:uncharacterized protein YndB with AHSA1/START domain